MSRTIWLGLLASIAATTMASTPVAAQQRQQPQAQPQQRQQQQQQQAQQQQAQQQQPQKPNILFVMGDDIGWMQPSIYHRGLMVGETPNIDRIGQEGAMYTHYTPSRAARPGAPPSSPACSRFASA